MSNRIAASRMIDRIEPGAWAAPVSPRHGLMVAVRGWFQRMLAQQDVFALSAHIRRDLGLPAAAATGIGAIDLEAGRRSC